MPARARAIWAFAITAVALFMIALDSLVVTTALPVIKQDLDAVQPKCRHHPLQQPGG